MNAIMQLQIIGLLAMLASVVIFCAAAWRMERARLRLRAAIDAATEFRDRFRDEVERSRRCRERVEARIAEIERRVKGE